MHNTTSCSPESRTQFRLRPISAVLASVLGCLTLPLHADEALNTQMANAAAPAAKAAEKPAEKTAESKAKSAEKKAEVAERIEVTGSGRASSARDVPMNITAIDEAELRERRLVDLKSLIADSVEISAPGNSARFADSVTVRGLNVSPVNANNLETFIRSTLAYYLDDTALPNIGFRIKDVARVEKLIGPQGTLYGAGSLGGTIRYITNKPSLEGQEFAVNSSVFQAKNGGISHDTDVLFNQPLGERFAVRASLYTLDEKGRTDRIVNPPWRTGVGGAPKPWTGSPNANQNRYPDDDWQKVDGGRVSLLWQISDDASLKFSHLDQSQTAHGSTGAQRLPTSRSGACTNIPVCSRYTANYMVNDHTVQARYEEFSDRDITMDVIDFDLQLAGFALHSSTSRYEDRRSGQADYADRGHVFYGTWIPPLSINNPNNDQSAYITFDNSNEGFSHETRLTSTGEGPLQWIAGVYVGEEERHLIFSEWFPTLDKVLEDTGLWFGLDRKTVGGRVDEGYFEDVGSDYQEKAVFGELSYALTDKWNATLGARWFSYDDEGVGVVVDYAGALVDSRAKAAGGESGKAFYKFNTHYNFSEDWLAYFTASQGFRRGGTNGFKDIAYTSPKLNVADEHQFFKPDTIDNLEIGFKGSFLNRRLYVQANAYQIHWNDTQTYFAQNIPDTLGLGLTFPLNGSTNGPDATSEGVEMMARWRMTDAWSLQFASAHTDARWDETKTSCLYEANNNPDYDCRTWSAGGLLGGAPKWKHNIGLRYSGEWGQGYSLSGGLDGRYVGATQSDRQDDPLEPVYTRPSYGLLNARIGIGMGNWDVSLWVENLADKRAEVSGQQTYSLGWRTIFVAPRTIGVNFSWRFEN